MYVFRLYHRLTYETTETRNNKNFLPNTVEDMKDLLKNLVIKDMSPAHRESLLILDNVSYQNVVSAFDIGLKMLVTTQNKDFVNYEANTHYIPVSIPLFYNFLIIILTFIIDRLLPDLPK